MATQYLTDTSVPASSAVAVWRILKTMVAAGWKVLEWSDGTTHHASGGGSGTAGVYTVDSAGDIKGGASGADNLGNAGAWARIADPGGTREYVFQYKGTDSSQPFLPLVGQWVVFYSASAHFTGTGFGAIGATVIPSATDGKVRCGYVDSGGALVGMPLFDGPDGSYRVYGAAADASPEWWWFGAITTGLGIPIGFLAQDVPDDGTGISGDSDIAVSIFQAGKFDDRVLGILGLSLGQSAKTASALTVAPDSAQEKPLGCGAWFRYGLADAVWLGVDAGFFGTFNNLTAYTELILNNLPGVSLSVLELDNLLEEQIVGAGNLGPNAFDGKDELLPVPWLRNRFLADDVRGHLQGMKFYSKVLRALGTKRPTGTLLDATGTKSHVVFNLMALPWDGASSITI